MKKRYWHVQRKDGSQAEGSYCLMRRILGRLFLGEKFTVIGDWS